MFICFKVVDNLDHENRRVHISLYEFQLLDKRVDESLLWTNSIDQQLKVIL